jgi:SAM-dependent methyltransferase
MSSLLNDRPGSSVRTRLNQWLSDYPGLSLVEEESQQVSEVLPDLFGYHIIQIGSLGTVDLLASSRVSHRTVINTHPGEATRDCFGPICLSGALPLVSESVDVVVLPHLLEFEPDPHQVLRETERILIGEGHLVILGFNPWSLWGLWRTVLAWRGEPPWCGRFFGIARIKDWLALLGFDIIKARRFYFRPPLPSEGVMSKLELLERIGRACWPYLGGAYIVVAKKRVATVTPVKISWRAHRQIISSGIAEPSTRGINNV